MAAATGMEQRGMLDLRWMMVLERHRSVDRRRQNPDICNSHICVYTSLT